jgi:hypothetical protein
VWGRLRGQVGGPSFFPIFLTLCSGQIVLIMAAKLLMRGARFSLGEYIGAAVMSLGMAIVVLSKSSIASPAAASPAAGSATSDDGNQIGAAAILLLGLLVLGVQKVLQEGAFEAYGRDAATVGDHGSHPMGPHPIQPTDPTRTPSMAPHGTPPPASTAHTVHALPTPSSGALCSRAPMHVPLVW